MRLAYALSKNDANTHPPKSRQKNNASEPKPKTEKNNWSFAWGEILPFHLIAFLSRRLVYVCLPQIIRFCQSEWKWRLPSIFLKLFWSITQLLHFCGLEENDCIHWRVKLVVTQMWEILKPMIWAQLETDRFQCACVSQTREHCTRTDGPVCEEGSTLVLDHAHIWEPEKLRAQGRTESPLTSCVKSRDENRAQKPRDWDWFW